MKPAFRASTLSDFGLSPSSTSLTTTIEDCPKRLILSVMGLEKHGKTRFALTAPDPLVYLATDTGDEGLLQTFKARGKRLAVGDYHVAKVIELGQERDEKVVQAIADACRPKWQAFKHDYLAALKAPKVRSIVVDTGTGVWELRRLSKFGTLSQVPALFYGQINAEMSLLLTAARHHDKNVIWVHRMRPEWEDKTDKKTGRTQGQKTGRYERMGYRDIGFEVMANLLVYRGELDSKGSPRPQARGEFAVEIQDCRNLSGEPTLDLAGETLEGEMCDFPHVAALAFGDNPANWQDDCYRRMNK